MPFIGSLAQDPRVGFMTDVLLTSLNKKRPMLKLEAHKSSSVHSTDTSRSKITFRMVAQLGVMLSSVALVALSLVSLCSARAIFGCPPVDDKNSNATLIANPLNCSTFFLCQQGLPVLMECPENLQFNDALKVCDYAFRANCVQLYPTFPKEEPAPTEVATEKIVVKKTVKEVVRPVVEDDAPVNVKSEVTEVEDEVPASVDAGDVTQAAVVDTDVDVDVNSVVKPVEGTVTEAAAREVVGNVADVNVDVNQVVL
ncbi:hypothetical protein HPB49_014322 [Dermacentor silvarum]|uniref:Uncharacterized protein n=1 Tax=Dermacentor silvarum TaxID=543639 RepID=A0ACB8CLI1_DERSI|nr:uncharacterized protein LOC119455483 [Dermacentor silvarum]KAH7945696.1 hypothetical protein HPB49_014322 [Dermacentor silvarum]